MFKGRNRWFFLLFLILVALTAFYLVLLPDVFRLNRENPSKTAFMKYREEEWKAKKERHKIVQIWVPLSKVSPYLINAVLIAEDDKFWQHEGFDYESIEKAIEKDIKAGKFRFGGSTISQQLARNLYLSPAKSIWRKFVEAVLTWKLERTLSKKRILELYLNLVEWGEGIFGAEAASRHYFGKHSIDLSPMEAARLAVILPNPRRRDPTGSQSYIVERSQLIYNIMMKRGILDPD
jgi:monofunctional biosynthetic peptidoglycan transglycosylase